MLTTCAALDCSTPHSAVHIIVADFAYCSTCWRSIARGGTPAALCATLLASEADRAKDAGTGRGRGRTGARR